MHVATPQSVPVHIIRELSVEASADPRTIRKVLAGERARGMVDARVRSALERRGLAPVAPKSTTP